MGTDTSETSAPRLRKVSAVDVGLRIGVAEAFLEDADLEPLDALAERLGVFLRLDVVLAGIEPVSPGQYLEEKRVVADVAGYGAGVVDRRLDRHDAGVGDQSVCRLHAVGAAIGRRDADGPALVAAHGHVDLARRDERGAAR